MPIHCPKISVLGVSTLKHYHSLSRPPKGTTLHETTSHKLSCVKISSVVFAVGDNKKIEKLRQGTKSHEVIIFHVFIEKPPVNGF